MSRFPATQLGRRAALLGMLLATLSAGQAAAQDKNEVTTREVTTREVTQTREVTPREVTPREENPEYRFDFGLFGGGHFFTTEHILGRVKGDPSEMSPRNSGMFGGHLGFHFNRWIGVEGEVMGIPTHNRDFVVPSSGGDPQTTKLWVFAYRASFVLHLNDNYMVQPFLLAGYGGMTSLSGNSAVVPGDTVGFIHGGVGFKVGFTPWIGIRLDGRILLPWTAVPGMPIGDRIGYTGPDFEAFAGLYVNFSEVEKIHIFHNERVIEKVTPKRGDRDGDGIPDDIDKCPNEPEDKDGFQDEDGCPDPDNDHDGIPDALDKCPNDPEDFDGFQDQDGCPDPDNDGDGIPDNIDKCPNEPETFNHYKDEDGCPDEVPPEVKKFTGVIEGINFKTASAEILPGSFAILDRALKVLQDFPEVNLEISGHTDSKGKADYNLGLSQRRADSVKLYFVSRGIASSRLTSVGFGKDRPIADNSTASGRATNRRTEFRLIDAAK
jgi:OmpA-OmpF porin, OOP family